MLRTLEAIRLETVLVGGRTRPLVVECRTPPSDSEEEPDSDFSDETKLMVVKAKGLPEVKEQNLFCELVGNVIAREVGIVTPHPAFINLSQPFVNSINPIVREHNIQLQTGVGVGCEYLRPLRQIIPTSHFSLEELEQAALIYGFDLLTQNSDRRIGKPNSALHKYLSKINLVF